MTDPLVAELRRRVGYERPALLSASADLIENQENVLSRVRELADEMDAAYPNVGQSIREALGDPS